MSDREKLPEWIDRYNQHELEGEELEKFLAMLKDNPKLIAEVNLDKDLNDMLSDSEMLEFREKIRKAGKKQRDSGDKPGINPRMYLIAASIVVLVGVVFLLFWITRNPETMTGSPFAARDTVAVKNHEADTLKKRDRAKPGQEEKQQEKLLLADNFRPDPALETLTGSVTRDGTFMMISPKNTDIIPVDDDIVFSWKQESKGSFRLVVLDNKGKLITGPFNISGTGIKIKAVKFGAGLYYYKISDGEELIHVGKFAVE